MEKTKIITRFFKVPVYEDDISEKYKKKYNSQMVFMNCRYETVRKKKIGKVCDVFIMGDKDMGKK